MKHSLRIVQFLGIAGLLATPCISTAQLLAQESFILDSAGVGYIPELNLERGDQNAPAISSGFQKWTTGFDNTDTDAIEDRWSVSCGCASTPFRPNQVSLVYPNLALNGGKLNVATGGLLYYGKINTTVDGPLGDYTSEGNVIDGKENATFFLSFLIQLKNIQLGANQNLVTLMDGVNTSRVYDETAQVYRRNPSTRLYFGQFWASDSFSVNGTNFAPLDTETHLIVIKIEFKSGDDTASVYFDPDVTQPESTATPVATIDGPMTFDAIRFVSQQVNDKDAGMALDEFRFGASWESVVPVTEEVTLSVASDKEGIPTVNTCPANMEVNCQATAKAGERFIRWTGDVTAANEYKESISVVMDRSKSLRAIIGMDMWGDDADLQMLGSGFLWRKDIGYMYEGYYPFIWIYSANNWVYVFDETGSAGDGYFMYDFGRNAFGFTGAAFYPYYASLPEATNISLGAPLE